VTRSLADALALIRPTAPKPGDSVWCFNTRRYFQVVALASRQPKVRGHHRVHLFDPDRTLRRTAIVRWSAPNAEWQTRRFQPPHPPQPNAPTSTS
jgi:hypothetical protein